MVMGCLVRFGLPNLSRMQDFLSTFDATFAEQCPLQQTPAEENVARVTWRDEAYTSRFEWSGLLHMGFRLSLSESQVMSLDSFQICVISCCSNLVCLIPCQGV